ncbi:MAG: hypothetical protein ACLQBJ_01310 [Bryobacteraceae bacterium]
MPRQAQTLRGGLSRYEVREQLNRILASRHFVKARKKSRFLEFLCEQAVSGVAESVNEYSIGVDIYERGADFDPQHDSIVRVQAHEIRKSLQAYYAEEGHDDRLRIDLPAGGYFPVFTRLGAEPPALPDEAKAAAEAPHHPPPARRAPYWIVLLAVCLALPAGWALRSLELRPAPVPAAPKLSADAAWFWQPFLPPAQPPLVVLPVHPLLRAAHAGDSAELRKRGVLISKDRFPEFRDTIHFRELPEFRFVPATTDFTGIGEALGLSNLYDLFGNVGQKLRIDAARLVDTESLKRTNVIVLGGNQSWSGRVFVYREGFEMHDGIMAAKKPLPGEQAFYKPEFDAVTGNLSRDYGVILMLPNERPDQRVLVLYGIYTQGTQAAIEFVTNPEGLRELERALVQHTPDKRPPRYFQALLTTTVENYVPGKISLVATRIIPE